MDNDADEKLHKAMRFLFTSVVSLVPGGGGIAASAFDLLIADPAQRRTRNFIEGLAERLRQLEERGTIHLDDLSGEGEASALFLQAIHVAARADGAKKIEALQNVAAKGASYTPSERHLSFIVMNLLERMTEPHISLLKQLNEVAGAKPIRRDRALMFGVGYADTSEGMTDPVATVNEGHYDRRNVAINGLIIHDLESLGVVTAGMNIPTNIAELSVVDGENGVATVAVSDVGRLVLGQIADIGSDD